MAEVIEAKDDGAADESNLDPAAAARRNGPPLPTPLVLLDDAATCSSPPSTSETIDEFKNADVLPPALLLLLL